MLVQTLAKKRSLNVLFLGLICLSFSKNESISNGVGFFVNRLGADFLHSFRCGEVSLTQARQPRVIIIAGPNGAGKSTSAPRLLQGELHVDEFVNADEIARGLSAFRAEDVAITAGKVMLSRLQVLSDKQVDFAFETTLASRNFARWIKKLQADGYSCSLVFLWLPNAEMAIARVRERVAAGGHNVPSETIRRRYERGLRNFFFLYRPVVDEWLFFDASDSSGGRLVASGSQGRSRVFDESVWTSVIEEYGHGKSKKG
jgi:predicted ABC-type ATPase